MINGEPDYCPSCQSFGPHTKKGRCIRCGFSPSDIEIGGVGSRE